MSVNHTGPEVWLVCYCELQGRAYVDSSFISSFEDVFRLAFAKFRKATISVVMYVRPSVRLHGTNLLQLDGFS
jgi:hypothetical protein